MRTRSRHSPRQKFGYYYTNSLFQSLDELCGLEVGVKTCSEPRGSWGESMDPLDPPKRLLYQPCQKFLSLAIK